MVLFGAGVQGRTQLEAACLARPSIERCWVSDLVPERAAAFAREMSEKLSIDVEPADDIRVRAREADLIVTATASDEPVVFPEDIHPGLTYIHIGGYECTAEAVLRADKLVFDDWSQVLHRGGTTPTDLFEQGLLPEERIYANLGQIICGQKPGRQSAEEYNYYNCVGLGVLDIAVAARLYRKAKARGVGITLPYWG